MGLKYFLIGWLPEYDPEGLWATVDEEVAVVVLPCRRALRLRVEHGGEQAVRVLSECGDRCGEDGSANIEGDNLAAHCDS